MGQRSEWRSQEHLGRAGGRRGMYKSAQQGNVPRESSCYMWPLDSQLQLSWEGKGSFDRQQSVIQLSPHRSALCIHSPLPPLAHKMRRDIWPLLFSFFFFFFSFLLSRSRLRYVLLEEGRQRKEEVLLLMFLLRSGAGHLPSAPWEEDEEEEDTGGRGATLKIKI